MLTLHQTYREDRCCKRWVKTAALWCAVSRRGPEHDGSLQRDPGLIYWRQGHREGADQPRKKRRRNERKVAAASSAVPGTAGADAAGSAAACW